MSRKADPVTDEARTRDSATDLGYAPQPNTTIKLAKFHSSPFDRPHPASARLRLRHEPVGVPRSQTWQSTPENRVKRTGYGGFPMPFQLAQHMAEKYAPKFTKRLERTLSQAPGEVEAGRDSTGIFSSAPVRVSRNSFFLDLTKEQKEELGGIEYRASKLLIKIVYCVSLAKISQV